MASIARSCQVSGSERCPDGSGDDMAPSARNRVAGTRKSMRAPRISASTACPTASPSTVVRLCPDAHVASGTTRRMGLERRPGGRFQSALEVILDELDKFPARQFGCPRTHAAPPAAEGAVTSSSRDGRVWSCAVGHRPLPKPECDVRLPVGRFVTPRGRGSPDTSVHPVPWRAAHVCTPRTRPPKLPGNGNQSACPRAAQAPFRRRVPSGQPRVLNGAARCGRPPVTIAGRVQAFGASPASRGQARLPW
jgi:hypothetical protein